MGVREYWTVDPDGDTVRIFRRSEQESPHFEPPLLLSAEADDPLTSPLFPGLEIPLREIFER